MDAMERQRERSRAEQLRVLGSLGARAHELVDTLTQANRRGDLNLAVQQLFGCSEAAAGAVLGCPMRMLEPARQRALRAEAKEIETCLDADSD